MNENFKLQQMIYIFSDNLKKLSTVNGNEALKVPNLKQGL